MKEFFNKHKIGIIVGVVIILFVALSLLMDSQEVKIDETKLSEEVKTWMHEVADSSEPIVTVFAASWCHNCANHKPVMEALQEQYGFKLYWFEMDQITNDEDTKALTKKYDISDYEGSVPFTFVTKKGKYKGYLEGAQGEEAVIEFLKKNNVIE